MQNPKIPGLKSCPPWTWVEITLWAIAAACQQGIKMIIFLYGTKKYKEPHMHKKNTIDFTFTGLSYTPDGFTSRSIFFLGYLTSYLLYTGFAAGITSILFQHDVRHLNINELKSSEIICLDYLRTDFNKKQFNYVSYNKI